MKLLKFFQLAAFITLTLLYTTETRACHGVALDNPTFTIGPTGVTINALSQSQTCGCDPYRLEVELACAPGSFTGVPQYLGNTMNKPNCVQQAYPPVFVPFAGLEPGCTYYLRAREYVIGSSSPGPWTTTFQFTVPGQQPAPLTIIKTQTLDTICIGGSTTLCVNASGGCFSGGGNYTYSWLPGNMNTNCVTVSPTVTTQYNVTVSTGCQDSVLSFIVIVDSMPSAGTASVLPNSICLGQNATLSIGFSIGDIQWQWAPGPNGPWQDIPGATTFSFTLIAPQTSLCYRAILTSCFGNIHDTSNVICLTVTPPPVVTVVDQYICETKFGTLTAIADTLGGTYEWQPGGVTTPSMTDNPQWTTTYTVTYILAACTTVAQGTIHINAKPYVDFFSDTVCLQNKTTFIDNTSLGLGSNLANWQWDFGDGNTSTNQNNFHAYNTYGYFTVKLVVTSDSGCVDSISKQVRVYDKPVANFLTKNICHGENAVFTNQSTVNQANIVLNSWMLGDGSTSIQQSLSHNYPFYGPYNVQLIVITDQGCADTVVKPIVVNPKPISFFTATNVCHTYATTFDNLSLIPQGSITGWLWYYGNGGASNAFNDSYTYNQWGNYKVTLIAISDSGCKDTSEVFVDVFPNPEPDFTLSTACQYDTLQFVDNSTIAAGSITQWYWDFGDGSPSSSQTNPVNIFYTASTYNIKMVLTSDKGCITEKIIPTDIYPKPKAEFTYSDDLSGCSPLCVNFFDQSTITNEFNSTIEYYNWNFNDGEFSGATNPVHCFKNRSKDRKIFSVELEVVSDFGCKDYYIVRDLVDVYPQPIAEFTFDPYETTLLNPVFNFTNHSHYESALSWHFGDGNTSIVENPKHVYGDTGTYPVTLVVKNDWGCTDTITYNVIVRPDLMFYIPNAFTPNGDGINDVFNMKGRGMDLIIPETFQMRIYDRWGELIYETADMNAGWNGTVKSKKVETEVFIYHFSFKDITDESHNLRGTVSVIR